MKRILRLCVTKTISPGNYLIKELDSINSCYLILSGVCELLSKKSPLKLFKTDGTFVNIKQRNDELCLGLNEGSMSKAFREFSFAQVTTGEWLGEDSIFGDRNCCIYSSRAKT